MDQLHYPMLLGTCVAVLAGVSAVGFRGRPLWLKIFANAVALALMTLSLRQVVGSPLNPRFLTQIQPDIWQQTLEAIWWVIAARLAINITRLAVVLESRPRETQFLSDLLVGVIYIFTFLAIVNFALNVHIQGLLETSGVIAIVLGLALQSTLSDVFSGIAVGLEKPFKPGDLLCIEGDIEGRVSQINWRSTHVITSTTNIAVIPNSVIAKAKIVNRSAPTSVRGDTLTVKLDNRTDSAICIQTLKAALKACIQPLTEPAPEVLCSGLFADGNEYQMTFFVPSSLQLANARNEIFNLVQRYLFYEGVSFSATGMTSLTTDRPSLEALLEHSELFQVLTPEVRQVLAKYFAEVPLQIGDTLLKQGIVPEAMMIISAGTAEVAFHSSAQEQTSYKLSPGDSLGSVGMFTNSASHSTAVALTIMRTFRLSKVDVERAVRENPALNPGLEALSTCNQAAIRRDAAMPPDSETIHQDVMVDKIRHFLRLLVQST
jgi:small-conductance mechanosensitive channel/CRP-like cAMP-binding protein